MKRESDIYEGYSPDVAGILRRKPRWIIRNGMLLLALLFVSGLFATWFIPWPESVNITLEPVYDGMISRDSVAITGTAVLPSGQAALVRAGMTVTVLAFQNRGNDPVRVKGMVTGLSDPAAAKSCRITVYMVLDRKEARSVMNAVELKAKIVTRETNILGKIFDPVISVIGRTRTNY